MEMELGFKINKDETLHITSVPGVTAVMTPEVIMISQEHFKGDFVFQHHRKGKTEHYELIEKPTWPLIAEVEKSAKPEYEIPVIMLKVKETGK